MSLTSIPISVVIGPCEVVASSVIEVIGKVVDDTGEGMELIVTAGFIPISVEVVKVFVVIADVGNLVIGVFATETIMILVGVITAISVITGVDTICVLAVVDSSTVAGVNTISVITGIDEVSAVTGVDTISVIAGIDMVSGVTGIDTISVIAGIDMVSGVTGVDTISVVAGIDTVSVVGGIKVVANIRVPEKKKGSTRLSFDIKIISMNLPGSLMFCPAR